MYKTSEHKREVMRKYRLTHKEETRLRNKKYFNNPINIRANSKRTLVRRRLNKEKAIEHLGGVCVDCKKKYLSCVYDFHHTNPTNKEHELNRIFQNSWNFVVKELEKCILLCSNCHRVRHG